jgi:hypothetical protein
MQYNGDCHGKKRLSTIENSIQQRNPPSVLPSEVLTMKTNFMLRSILFACLVERGFANRQCSDWNASW